MATPKYTQATRKKPSPEETNYYTIPLHLREAILILSGALAVFLLTTLLGFQHILFSGFGGRAGAAIAAYFLTNFGYVSYFFPLIIMYVGWLLFRANMLIPDTDYHHSALRLTGFLLSLVGINSLFSILFSQANFDFDAGGVVGNVFSQLLINPFGTVASAIIFTVSFLIGMTLFADVSWFKVLDLLGKTSLAILGVFSALITWFKSRVTERKIERRFLHDQFEEEEEENIPKVKLQAKKRSIPTVPPKIEKPKAMVIPSQRARQDRQATLFKGMADGPLPSLNLLDPPTSDSHNPINTAALEETSREVEARLLDFNIEVQVVAVHPGPVITRFELQPAPGLKVSKIVSLAKDLARSLSVTSVRIVDVIPGKATIGLEVPNEDREVVRLSEVLSSQQYDQARSVLSLALGKDISGHPVIVDLAKMPHLLVAGTTGSGKSVGVNAMILSLLFKATPDEVRLIMIDPKMLELSIYSDIPHLLTPVVTDMKEAANALRWCVAEMERRYKLMANLGVRNLASFNQKIKDAQKAKEPILDPFWNPQTSLEEEQPELTTLPYIVVIIDEFADMMMVVGKKVEELIARIAQKARAAGIHMILATQRPSVDVITGLIKANIPARIAFQVSSRIDSRTILDQQGAEQLLGNGDMLYLTPGSGLPIRIHGAFVDDHEVHAVVADWRARGEPDYIEQVTQTTDPSETGENGEGGDSEQDPLYDQAVQIVLDTRKASISNIQRRLKIGYNRAARLVEAMELAGLVSPMESNGNREILVPNPNE